MTLGPHSSPEVFRDLSHHGTVESQSCPHGYLVRPGAMLALVECRLPHLLTAGLGDGVLGPGPGWVGHGKVGGNF